LDHLRLERKGPAMWKHIDSTCFRYLTIYRILTYEVTTVKVYMSYRIGRHQNVKPPSQDISGFSCKEALAKSRKKSAPNLLTGLKK
jgi:hypothetical protein